MVRPPDSTDMAQVLALAQQAPALAIELAPQDAWRMACVALAYAMQLCEDSPAVATLPQAALQLLSAARWGILLSLHCSWQSNHLLMSCPCHPISQDPARGSIASHAECI